MYNHPFIRRGAFLTRFLAGYAIGTIVTQIVTSFVKETEE